MFFNKKMNKDIISCQKDVSAGNGGYWQLFCFHWKPQDWKFLISSLSVKTQKLLWTNFCESIVLINIFCENKKHFLLDLVWFFFFFFKLEFLPAFYFQAGCALLFLRALWHGWRFQDMSSWRCCLTLPTRLFWKCRRTNSDSVVWNFSE